MKIKELVEKGVYKKDVAEELGVSPKTVTRVLARGAQPQEIARTRTIANSIPSNLLSTIFRLKRYGTER